MLNLKATLHLNRPSIIFNFPEIGGIFYDYGFSGAIIDIWKRHNLRRKFFLYEKPCDLFDAYRDILGF